MRETVAGLLALLVAGCAAIVPEAPLSPDTIFAITRTNVLIRFNAGRPGQVDSSQAVSGLAAGEKLLGIDFRPANGRLYAAGSSGRLYTLDTGTGAATALATGNFTALVRSEALGFDINPVSDRVHITDGSGSNFRLHPETGSLVDGNPMLAGVQPDAGVGYAREDVHFGRPASVVGVAYTNGPGARETTSFAIDAAQGTLATLGRPEGTTPAKTPFCPSEGRLFTVGRLGVQSGAQVGFDIHPLRRNAYATFQGGELSALYAINLLTGEATRIGIIGSGVSVLGIAIAP
ncbi:MAG: DUF4394 domain-containing protein [Betaproteobacteria bacterium]|nr:DUF4394 domain-containing protein [Betaproteobacteria bacterium]